MTSFGCNAVRWICLAACGALAACYPPLTGEQPHDSNYFAYFNAEAKNPGETPVSPGSRVADGIVLWEVPAAERACVRRHITAADPKQAKRQRQEAPAFCHSFEPDRNLVAAAISGGGKKSEVFALNVLLQLEKYRLLDEIDVVSGASGGSFAAMFYALSCDGDTASPCAESWRPKWSSVSDIIEENFFWPWVFRRLRPDHLALNALTYHNSSESMVTILQSQSFLTNKPDGSPLTFDDLNPARPSLIVNATDLTQDRTFRVPLANPSEEERESEAVHDAALHFSFTAPYFKEIRSDLSRFELARALTASAAYPVILDPVSLRNFSVPPTTDKNGKISLSFVHLMDGGVADNMAAAEPGWLIKCLFGEPLRGATKVEPFGAQLSTCPPQRADLPAPSRVLVFPISSSQTDITAYDPNDPEVRLARWGIPIRFGTTEASMEVMSLANSEQRKVHVAEVVKTIRENTLAEAASVAPLDFQTFDDALCNGTADTDGKCILWRETAKSLAKAHGPDLNDDPGKILKSIKAVQTNFKLSDDERKALKDAASWIVALRLVRLCGSGDLGKLFPAKADDVCRGAPHG
jgi:predicted acylesterase/phospholipase RssA